MDFIKLIMWIVAIYLLLSLIGKGSFGFGTFF